MVGGHIFSLMADLTKESGLMVKWTDGELKSILMVKNTLANGIMGRQMVGAFTFHQKEKNLPENFFTAKDVDGEVIIGQVDKYTKDNTEKVNFMGLES